MQNRYVGDVGDFAKYGLLRLLMERTALSLGVLWWLVDDETHNSDGRHINYLKNSVFSSLDPQLHQVLSGLIATSRRSVKAIAKSRILPEATVFFDKPISRASGTAVTLRGRADRRAVWLRSALVATADCDIVFFDPDNGLETRSVARHAPKGGKYVFWDELLPFWDRGQSLVIYHHLNRTASVAKQTAILQEKFGARFAEAAFVRYFLFRRGSCRHFWLVAQRKHALHFRGVINRIAHSDWHEYFEVG
jgi:hypothetical protein